MLLATVVLSAALLAQQGQPQATILRGAVTRLTDSQPIAGARISVLPAGNAGQRALAANARGRGTPAEFSVTSDNSGRFAVVNIPAGTYTIAVQSDGYFAPRTATGEYPAVASGEVVIPPQGTEVRVGLIPGSTISGAIRDSSGNPARNITATLSRATYQNGMPALLQVATRDTDDRGQFRLFRVPPGEYYLSGVALPPPQRGAQPQRGQAPARVAASPREISYKTYFPGAIDLRDATPIVLKGGEELNSFSFIMRSGTVAKVTGRVAAPGFASLYLVPRDRSIPEGSVQGLDIQISGADTESRFEIDGILPGAYYLFATVSNAGDFGDVQRGRGARGPRGAAGQPGARGRGTEGLSGATLFGGVPINIAGTNIDGLSIAMLQTSEIRGAITLDGTPFNNGNVQVTLVGDEHLGGLGSSTGGRGPQNFGVLPGIPYRFLVSLPPNIVQGPGERPLAGAYVADIVVDGRSVFDRGFSVGAGVMASYEVALKRGGGSISGNVLGPDRKPVAGAMVVIAPSVERRQNLNLYSNTTSDASGHFEVRGIAPGDYKMFAFGYLPTGAFQNSSVIGRYEDRGAAVSVRANESLTANLDLIN